MAADRHWRQTELKRTRSGIRVKLAAIDSRIFGGRSDQSLVWSVAMEGDELSWGCKLGLGFEVKFDDGEGVWWR